MVEMGSDVNAWAKHGLAPLHMTASEGYLETVRVLLELGANVLSCSEELY
jgi:ankyrin repeat protein